MVATIIHEILHTLGLRENPPTSSEITARVLSMRAEVVGSSARQFRTTRKGSGGRIVGTRNRWPSEVTS